MVAAHSTVDITGRSRQATSQQKEVLYGAKVYGTQTVKGGDLKDYEDVAQDNAADEAIDEAGSVVPIGVVGSIGKASAKKISKNLSKKQKISITLAALGYGQQRTERFDGGEGSYGGSFRYSVNTERVTVKGVASLGFPHRLGGGLGAKLEYEHLLGDSFGLFLGVTQDVECLTKITQARLRHYVEAGVRVGF